MARIILLFFGLMVSAASYSQSNPLSCSNTYVWISCSNPNGFSDRAEYCLSRYSGYAILPAGCNAPAATVACTKQTTICTCPAGTTSQIVDGQHQCFPVSSSSSSSSAPSCNIGEEVWADYAIEDQMPVCTGGCTGTRSPGACYGGGIGCQVKFTITGPCEEDTCEGDECTSGGEQSSSSSDDSESSSSSVPSTSSSGASNSSSGNGGDGDGSGDGNGSGSGSSGGNSGGSNGSSGNASSGSGDCDPTSSNYFQCAGLIEQGGNSSTDYQEHALTESGKIHDGQIKDISEYGGVSFFDKSDFFKDKLNGIFGQHSCPVVNFTWRGNTQTLDCTYFNVFKTAVGWILYLFTFWNIFHLATRPVNR